MRGQARSKGGLHANELYLLVFFLCLNSLRIGRWELQEDPTQMTLFAKLLAELQHLESQRAILYTLQALIILGMIFNNLMMYEFQSRVSVDIVLPSPSILRLFQHPAKRTDISSPGLMRPVPDRKWRSNSEIPSFCPLSLESSSTRS